MRPEPEVIIFAIAVIIALIMRAGWRPSKPNMPSIKFPFLATVKILIWVAFLVWATTAAYKSVTGLFAPDKPVVMYITNMNPTSAGGNASAQSAPPVSYGKNMTPYFFGAQSCFKVMLMGDASIYPKGGTITIYPPEGEPWDSTPGVNSRQSGTRKPAGEYRMCKKDASATGAEIFQ
jgi:hypothetical protein